jgi:hypothetical protein
MRPFSIRGHLAYKENNALTICIGVLLLKERVYVNIASHLVLQSCGFSIPDWDLYPAEALSHIFIVGEGVLLRLATAPS